MKVNALMNTPAFLENVMQTMSDGLMVVDPEGTIRSFNAAAERITGYRSEEVIGKPCSILDTDTWWSLTIIRCEKLLGCACIFSTDIS